MFIAVIIYFFCMRSKTVRIKKHLALTQLRKSQQDNASPSPNKTMSLISYDRMSPEKIMPMPYPVTEQMDQPSHRKSNKVFPERSSSAALMNIVKMQKLDSQEAAQDQL